MIISNFKRGISTRYIQTPPASPTPPPSAASVALSAFIRSCTLFVWSSHCGFGTGCITTFHRDGDNRCRTEDRQTPNRWKRRNKARRDHSIILASFSISGGGLVWPADPAVSPAKRCPGQRRSFRNPTTHLSKDDALLGVWRHRAKWHEVAPGLLFTSTVGAAQKVRGWRRPVSTRKHDEAGRTNSYYLRKLVQAVLPHKSGPRFLFYWPSSPAYSALPTPLSAGPSAFSTGDARRGGGFV